MSSNQLLMAGLLSALGLGGAGMKAISSSGSRPLKSRKGGSKKVQSSGLGGSYPVNGTDLSYKPPSYTDTPKRIPRNIGRMISWDVFKVNSQITASGTQVVETNFTFSHSQNPQSATWLTIFDQYCIVAATVEFDSLTPPGQTYSSPVLYTALDFDNSSAISTIASIEEYDTCECIVMAPEKRHFRSVKPGTKSPLLVNGGSYSNTAAAAGPTWVDSGNNNVIHYGIRSIVNFFNAGQVNVTQTLYIAYRNHI